MALLPALRQELTLLPAPKADDGSPRWFLFDPVKNGFHLLTRQAVDILKHWRAETPEAALGRLKKDCPQWEIDKGMLRDMAAFLYQQNLTQAPPAGQADIFARQDAKSRKPLFDRLMQSSLFFRIPLFQPHKFLTATAPFLSFLFKKKSWVVIALIGLIGLIFTARQWDEFLSTFMYFFTLEGFLFYTLTLTLIKMLHELGHAYTAHHFGARVPIMGLAFLLMFPVLYTDTTDAWRLTSRRQRVLIDAGGMIAEFAIACTALFLWSFLPDGPARSVAFFTATTSWGLSLMVNLNPCMRFDGYYLLADLCGFQNMQASGFELARWKMRKTLWGLNNPKPFTLSRRKESILLTYAYTTWAYRVFLFVAIGLLAYHFLPKPFGVLFFAFILSSFIAAPIWRELKQWFNGGRELFTSGRARTTLSLGLAALWLFLWPWQTRITAPALIRPALHTEIYALSPAQIDHIHIRNGDSVSQGDTLISLSSDELTFQRNQSFERLTLLTAQMNRQAAGLEQRRWTRELQERRSAEALRLQSIDVDIAGLTLTAPHDGVISGLPDSFHKGRYIRSFDRALTMSSARAEHLIALPKEGDIHRIVNNTRFTFISSDASASKMTGRVTAMAPTSVAVITDRLLTSVAGGPVAVNIDDAGRLIPHAPVFKLEGHVKDGTHLSREQRGTVTLEATPQSPASKLWRSILRVLIREVDF